MTPTHSPLCEKGSSNWLLALLAKDQGMILIRGEFTDAINLRYYRELRDTTENSEILQRTQRYYRELRDTTENSEILQRTQRYYRELRDTTENSEVCQQCVHALRNVQLYSYTFPPQQ